MQNHSTVECLAAKIINHTASFMTKFVGTLTGSHISWFYCFEDLQRLEKVRRGQPKKESNCNNVYRLCQQANLKINIWQMCGKSSAKYI